MRIRLDPHSFSKLDPDPHSLKNLDPNQSMRIQNPAYRYNLMCANR
jgi:hypothetical protein